MLYGIDISNNNKGLNLTDTSLLYIMKATQGTSFVDRYCDPWVQWCIANSVPWGFYHFMSKNYGVAEAEFFYRNTRNYFTHGVPILDFEQDGLTDEEAESFVWRIHELSGVWPLVYTYSDFINGQGHLKNSWVKDKCGLWLAGYPSRRTGWPSDATCPYPHAGWTLAMWQFTNCLSYNGYSVDGDVFYGDTSAWKMYVGGGKEANGTSIDGSAYSLARRAINGEFGNGSSRKAALGDRYSEVQGAVNMLLNGSDTELAKLVVSGKLGNGAERKAILGSRYAAVQRKVNSMV